MARMRKSATKVDGRRSGKARAWSKADHRELKRHSKAKTHVSVISRAMKRTVGALRQQALKLGIGFVVAFVSPIKGSAMLDVAEKRGQIIRFLEEALALADEIEDGHSGYMRSGN